jgi:glycosyltransferase involved in cell wall biosynthesis
MKVALFFTRGNSLAKWHEQGLLAREKQMYEALLDASVIEEVYWVTYGHNDDVLADRLQHDKLLHPNIRVLPMPAWFTSKWKMLLYSAIAPILLRKQLAHCCIYKTNQMDGAWAAVISKLLFRKKLFVRTGFTLSQLELLTNGKTVRQRFFSCIERIVYRFSDAATVSSVHNKKYLRSIGVQTAVEVLPNYVDTTLFHPNTEGTKRQNRMLAVGRLVDVKNYKSLIRAAAAKGIGLDIYGGGEREEELKALAASLNADVIFCGIVYNTQLPDIMRRYRYYAISSYSEGMPKALLEAMACGCVCLGTDVNGINEVIKDGTNGILASGVDATSLIHAMERLDLADQNALRDEALKTIESRYSLKAIVLREGSILRQLGAKRC